MKSSAVVLTFPTISSYPLTVDYDISHEEMVKRCKYDKTSDGMKYFDAKDFPASHIKGTADINVELVHFNDNHLTSQEVVDKLDMMGLRPATLSELLAFGEKYSEIKHTIVALGSTWLDKYGDCCVAFLDSVYRNRPERTLHTYLWDVQWDDWDRFATVRK